MCCKFNRKDTFSHDAYGLQELSIFVLTQLIALQLQFKMEFKFSHDHFASIFLCTYNYNHCGTQFFVSLSLWNVFFLIIYFVIRRSVKFQHAVNRSGPDLFQCKPLMFRLSFTESCMISSGRTDRNCLNLSNQDTGQNTHRSFLFCFASQKEQWPSADLWSITLSDNKGSSMEKHLFISLIS